MGRLSESEIGERVERLRSLQQPCQLCPRRCLVDRLAARGFCGQPLALQVAATCAHGGEEPPLSGCAGAGTIFVAGCTMQCCFCQNYQISQPERLETHWIVTPQQLAQRMLALQQAGCHNVEWVSPTQHLPSLVDALWLARGQGLTLPLVYNCNGYQRPELLRLLDGIVDVYLPDAKYASPDLARRLSATGDYVELNRRTLLEMQRQVGPLQLDGDGLAMRGLLVRHLVLPGELANTRAVLRWIAGALGVDTWVSVMAQYYPAHRARGGEPDRECGPGAHIGHGALDRRLTPREHDLALDALELVGLENGWIQQRATGAAFCPDFRREDPFQQGGLHRPGLSR